MPKIDYVPVGDYLLPAITLRDPPDAEPLTKYGLMRKSYLKTHRPILYNQLLLAEKLYPHLRATQRAAEERMDTMMVQLAQRNPPPDKAACSLLWAQHMAGLHHTAEEIIFAELIYE
jgi:hypothetical protein